LGDGMFVIYADRVFRKKIVCLDVPLLEVQLTKNQLHLTPLVKGEVDGMKPAAFVDVNRPRVDRLTAVSRSFALWELQHAKNAIISFSGGKDSTVLADVLKEFKLPKVFIDTRLEFPETYSFIREGNGNGNSLDIARAECSFFSLCQEKGFPKHGYRWCCKTQKFEPFANYLRQKYGDDDVFVFTGERRWEGLYRMTQPLRKTHKHIPNQQTIQPMLDWFVLDIWCYILDKQLPYNNIYNIFDRAGCWVCPFGLDYRGYLLQFSHPKLYQALVKVGGVKPTRLASAMSDNPCSDGYRLNWGKIRKADGVGKVTGECGDTIELHIKVDTGKIIKAKFTTDGCHSIIACGDIVTELAKDKSITQANNITPNEVLSRVKQIPEAESHCATLAVNALREAIKDYSKDLLALTEQPVASLVH
jgi:3'-phosphoadenosine 5'-phosphosulfate sulfotransferase (PAPS reductase)/FAD synthetase